MTRSRRFALTTLLVALVSAPAGGLAQTYPDRPVKIVVPIGPAGSYDILGRVVADQLTRRLGQTFTVENRPGAGTVVGTKAVISSPPDGYTLLVGGLSNIVFNAGLYKNLSYDPLADLTPVALVLNISYTLIGSNSLAYTTPKEIIAAAKKNPGALKLANAGVGTGQHIVGAAFQAMTGTKFLEVAYRGSSLAFPDLLGGRVDLFFDSTPAALPYVKSGQVKGIAILTAKRNPQAPDVPTMTEFGCARLRDQFLDRDLCAGTDAARRHRAAAAAKSRPPARRSSPRSQRSAASSWRSSRTGSNVSSGPTMIGGSRSSRTPA